MFFKIKIQGSNPTTKQEIENLYIYSPPIKVISKPEKRKANSLSSESTAQTTTISKKKSTNELLLETVARIEQQQEQQQVMIMTMLQQQNNLDLTRNPNKRQAVESSFSSTTTSSTGFLSNPIVPISRNVNSNNDTTTSTQKPELDFEKCFNDLIQSYNAISQEERPQIIRSIIRNSTARDSENLSELLDLFYTTQQSDLNRNPNLPLSTSTHSSRDGGCTCQQCPYQTELQRIDEFYKEFLESNFNINTMM